MKAYLKVVKTPGGVYALDMGDKYMQASCHHHKRKRKAFSACGGCYARAVETLSALAEDMQIPEAIAFIQALREEV